MGKSGGVVVALACCCAIFLLHFSVAIAQTCGSQAGGAVCANNLCCSKYGYCGSTDAYCGDGCQSGPCTGSSSASPPPPPSSGSSTGGVGSILSSSMFDTFFPNRNSSFYTYDAFTAGAAAYSSFGTSGSVDDQKREVAAFCAHVKQETGGLLYVEEINKSDYCDSTYTQYPCAANKQYYGRGPLQISWNYNYGAASGSVGEDILSNPDLVAQDSTLAFKTAFWFWTTASGSKPSCHDVMIGNWTPSSSDTAAGRAAGFGVTIDIINGGIECGSGTATAAATNRVTYYKDFCSQLGVDPGQNLDCTNMQSFS